MYGLPLGPGYGGFVSDLVRVPYARSMLVPIGEGLDPAAVASLSDNIPDAWRTVGPHLEAEPGATVLICGGAGSIPVYAAALALAAGAERVDYAGGREGSAGSSAGSAPNLLDPGFPDRLGPYPIVVDASASHEGLACALRSTEPEGICTSIGIYFEPETPSPSWRCTRRGSVSTPDASTPVVMEPILDLVRSGAFEPQQVTRETAAWDDAAEAVASHGGKLVISR